MRGVEQETPHFIYYSKVALLAEVVRRIFSISFFNPDLPRSKKVFLKRSEREVTVYLLV